MIDWYTSPADHPLNQSPDLFRVELGCGNDSFKPYWNIEAGNILHELADKLIRGESVTKKLFDGNGNSVGSVTITGDEDTNDLMGLESLKEKMVEHVEAISKLLESHLEQKGNKAYECQKVYIRQKLFSLEAGINGISEEDLQG